MSQHSFETREGERRTVVELQVDEVGPSLRRAKAQVSRSGQVANAYSGQPLSGQVSADPYAQAPRQADGPVFGGQSARQYPQSVSEESSQWPGGAGSFGSEPPF